MLSHNFHKKAHVFRPYSPGRAAHGSSQVIKSLYQNIDVLSRQKERLRSDADGERMKRADLQRQLGSVTETINRLKMENTTLQDMLGRKDRIIKELGVEKERQAEELSRSLKARKILEIGLSQAQEDRLGLQKMLENQAARSSLLESQYNTLVESMATYKDQVSLRVRDLECDVTQLKTGYAREGSDTRAASKLVGNIYEDILDIKHRFNEAPNIVSDDGEFILKASHVIEDLKCDMKRLQSEQGEDRQATDKILKEIVALNSRIRAVDRGKPDDYFL